MQSHWFYYRQRMNFDSCKTMRKIYVMPKVINACLAITGAIRGTSKEKLYDELSLDSFQHVAGSESCTTFTNFTKINLLSIFSN